MLTPAEVFAIIEEALEERRQWERWADSRNANLMCLLANIHRGKSPPFKPADFLPHERPKTPEELEARIDAAFAALRVETIIIKPPRRDGNSDAKNQAQRRP
jgi:hypothetical protein